MDLSFEGGAMKRLLVALSLVLLLFPCLTSVVFAQERYNYIGPWVWDITQPYGPGWRGPDGMLGCIDLRSIPQMSTQGGPPGLGFFVTDSPLPAPYILLSTALDNAILPARMSTLEKTWVIKIDALTLRGLLWELLAEKGDPTGLIRWKPLTPGWDGTIRLDLGGYSPVVLKRDNLQGREKAEVMATWRDTI